MSDAPQGTPRVVQVSLDEQEFRLVDQAVVAVVAWFIGHTYSKSKTILNAIVLIESAADRVNELGPEKAANLFAKFNALGLEAFGESHYNVDALALLLKNYNVKPPKRGGDPA